MFRRLMIAALVAAMPFGAGAETRDAATFDIYLRGLKAAQFAISSVETGGNYSTRGKMQTSGLVGWLRKAQFDASAQGRVRSGGYVPSLYEEVYDNDGKVRTARMAYRRGVPQGRELTPPNPPRAGDIDPASQGGTWDLMTALHAVLRTKPRDKVCDLNQFLFDGRRRTQLVLGAPTVGGDTITCSAELRRIGGYSEAEMAERRTFPFRLTYAPAGDGAWHVVEVAMETTYGTGSMVRR